jgi:hypothetical protein
MELLIHINKTKFLIPYEQLYIQSHHHHKQLIPEQNSSEYNPMYQLDYDQQDKPQPKEPPDIYPNPQIPTSQLAQNMQRANSKKCTQFKPQTASVVPPEDGCLASETCRGL